jgi:hypothetical protein
VDFVIPRVGVDLPLGIDPFLMYKSRDEEFRKLHQLLVDHFNSGIEAVKQHRLALAEEIFDFPEVSPIGFGYTKSGKRGSGLGGALRNLIIETLRASPGLQERGVFHVEEMQLLAAGIGPDRVSDISANVLKRYLIGYTQRQAELWGIPITRGVPVSHIYDETSHTWTDSYEDLPVSPVDGSPVIFVPRRIVRALPWINYDDFVQHDFRAFMQARRANLPKENDRRTSATAKAEVANMTRMDVSIVDRYVKSREQRSDEARPTFEYLDEQAQLRASSLIERLAGVRPGRESARDFQFLVLEILNFLFSPELIDGRPEVRTVDGTERRDIIFTNDSDESFWSYIRSAHDGVLVMFEAKNTEDVDMEAINQTATYLGDRLGRFGIIVTRKRPSDNVIKKTYSVWNDSGAQRKVTLIIDDSQLIELLNIRAADRSPTKWMQNHYRNFRTSVQ